MLYLPPDPKPGQPIRADTITAILKYLRQITPRTSGTCNVQTGAGGSTFRPIFPRGLAQLSSGGQSRNLWVYDASSELTPQISVTPGAFNGSIIPTLGGNPINAQIGSPLAWPVLSVSGDTLVYLALTYNSSNVLTAVAILAGTLLPTTTIVPGTAGTDYYGLSTISVTITGGKASVTALNDYVSGNQGYDQCGTTSRCWLK